MKTFIRISPFLLLIIITNSCGKPDCRNTNPIFDKYSCFDNEYKVELVKQLRLIDPSKLSYYIDKYYNNNNEKLITVDIVGRGLCVKGVFDISNENITHGSFKYFFAGNGLGYRGAELWKFKYKIDSTEGKINFIVVDIGGIID